MPVNLINPWSTVSRSPHQSQPPALLQRSVGLFIFDEINRLEQLRSQGTLTEEEFIEDKQRVLAGDAETILHQRK